MLHTIDRNIEGQANVMVHYYYYYYCVVQVLANTTLAADRRYRAYTMD